MPEQDIKQERILTGESTVTPSSDAAIEATLEQLRRQIHGLPEPEVVIEGESLAPKSLARTTIMGNSGTSSQEEIMETRINLGPSDSALGRLIHQRRVSKLKRAA